MQVDSHANLNKQKKPRRKKTVSWLVQKIFHWLQSIRVSKCTYSLSWIAGAKSCPLSPFARFSDIRHPSFCGVESLWTSNSSWLRSISTPKEEKLVHVSAHPPTVMLLQSELGKRTPLSKRIRHQKHSCGHYSRLDLVHMSSSSYSPINCNIYVPV